MFGYVQNRQNPSDVYSVVWVDRRARISYSSFYQGCCVSAGLAKDVQNPSDVYSVASRLKAFLLDCGSS